MSSDHCTHQPLPGLNPCASQTVARVIENELIATNTWRMKLYCPDLARAILPGQFFMIRPVSGTDPVLGRPFALLDTWQDENGYLAGIEFGYVVVGRMTTAMSRWSAGDVCRVWGPLGNGFPVCTGRNLLMVAGGIGQTPFLAVGQELLGNRSYGQPVRVIASRPEKVRLCYGARSAEYLACIDQFEAAGIPVSISTDNGSRGHHGLVTDLVREAVSSDDPPDAIYCCGPERMMAAVAKIADESGIACWLSLETPMACGFGICFSCVTRVRMSDGSTDYQRTCVEGPVFPAEKLCLEV